MPATFSVPARRRRSWLPPTSSDSTGVPRRTNMAPTPFGPCILWALIESRWHPNLRTSNWTFARALDRVDMEEDAGVGGNLADFCHRLQDAGFIVGEHHADEPGLGTDGAQNIVRVDQAAGLGATKVVSTP